MLFCMGGWQNPVRFQGAYVDVINELFSCQRIEEGIY